MNIQDKRQEIGSETAGIILRYLLAIHAELIHSHDDVFLTNKILQFLDSQGIVIADESAELPMNPSDKEAELGMWAIYHEAQQDMLKAGYHKTYPLVSKEGI